MGIGVDIHTGRANAIKVLLRFLAELQQNQPHFDFTLANIRGGSIRNAIPRESVATLVFNGDITVLQSAVQKFADVIKAELALTEPNLIFTLEKVEKPQQVFSSQCTKNIIHCLNILPNGVVRNSDVIENVVETSLSIGVLKTEDNFVRSTMLVRSLIESGKSYVASLLKSLASLAQGNINLSGDYPGWEPQSHSDILDLTKTIYAQVLGTDPEIKVIHAGLECGLLKKSIQRSIWYLSDRQLEMHILRMKKYIFRL